YGTREGLSHEDVLCVREGRDGGVWIGTRSALNLFRNGKFTTYTTDGRSLANQVNTVMEDPEGTVWFSNLVGGLHRLKDGEHSIYGTNVDLTDRGLWAICRCRDGTLWVGGRDGLFRMKEGK